MCVFQGLCRVIDPANCAAHFPAPRFWPWPLLAVSRAGADPQIQYYFDPAVASAAVRFVSPGTVPARSSHIEVIN